MEWAAPVSGAWGVPSNWSPMNVPDTPGESAVLGLLDPYSVSLAFSPGIGELHITNAGVVLTINAGNALTLNGPLASNEGQIHINPQNSGADAHLVFGGPVALSGAGEIWLRTNTENSQISGIGPFTNGAAHTVRGAGYVRVPTNNEGAILADAAVAVSGNQLFVFEGPFGNSGIMGAAGASRMDLTNTTLTQTGAGELLAMDGDGQVRLGNGLTVIGGTLASEGDGSIQTIGSPTLRDVASSALFSLNAGTTVSITGGGLINDGIIQVNPQSSGADAHLHFPLSADLTGSGEVWLRTNNENSQVNAGAGEVVVHGPDHTIRGVGYVSAGMVNEGLVAADVSVAVSGNQLHVFGETKVNDGVMKAAANSLLDITSTTIDQTGGGSLLADATGQVRLGGNALVRAGEFAGNGALSTIGHCTLESLTINGASFVNEGHVATISGLGLVNNGVLTVNNQNSGADTYVHFAESGVLEGSGEVRMRTNAENSRVTSAEGVTVTQGAGHTIRGVGYVTAALVNHGLVLADDEVALSGNTLHFFGGAKVNQSLCAAAGGAVLAISSTTLTQSGGDVLAMNGNGQVHLGNDLTVIGGTLTSDGDGTFQTVGSPTLQDVTSNGTFFLNAGHTVSVAGDGLTNNGTIHINAQNSGADSSLHFPLTAELAGSGEVRLRTNNENSRVTSAAGEVVLHGPDHAIRGVGYVSAGMVNEGLVAADVSVAVSGKQLHVFGEPKVNAGVMKAAANSLLDITATTIDQTLGGVLRADATGQVRLGGDAIVRTGSVEGDGLFSTIGNSTLEGVTLDIDSSFNAGNTVGITGGGLTNNGVIAVNPQNSGADAVIYFPANASLSGSGRIDLLTGQENARLSSASGVVVTQDAGHTIGGIGQVNVLLANNGGISPGNSVGSLAFGADVTFGPTASLTTEIAGTGSYDQMTVAGQLTLDGTLEIVAVGGYTPALGHSFTIASAATLTGEFDAINGPGLPGQQVWAVQYRPTQAILRVTCRADTNVDGVLNTQDVLAFLNAWTAGEPEGDFNRDGNVNTLDVLAFLNSWTSGC
jgi:hypothetical protein